jgi:DNA (cytosine-5)-methyltransferase 3A
MNVLSLFDGMSCGQIALNRAGIKYENYYASEIDKYAIQVTQHNYPNTIQLGDITQINGDNLPKIDLLFGGSPCQGFSFAGKQLNFEDTRSKLFFEFVRLKDELNPKYFLLENVKMKKEYSDIITKYLGVEPILINSNLVSAQNRERLYWSYLPNFTPPTDKKIMLNDLIPGAVSMGIRGRKFKGDNHYTRITTTRKDGKANCLVTTIGCTNLLLINGHKRNITIDEAEILQTLRKGYTDVQGISKSARTKMIGNGWTVDVITHFFKNAKKYEKIN